jgi:spoIIIJ-associated protein
MRSVETDGASIDDAIERALGLLHVTRDKVDIEILENSSRGLLGFGGKRARVRATVRSPLGALSEQPSDMVSRETLPGGEPEPIDVQGRVDRARAAFVEILSALGLAPEFAVVAAPDETWQFTVAGAGAGIVIGRHGQTLDAIEYLLNRIASHCDKTPVRIAIDVEGYRERRQESVEQVARQAAEKARATGRPVTLAPMSARDRRTVHVALGDDREITTRSEGEGSFRRVVIVPSRSPGSRSS